MRTDAGRDFMAGVLGNPSSTGTGLYAPARYMALSTNNAEPSAADTALTSEIVAGTLVRAAGTYGHTDGTAVYTLTHTFIADQSVEINRVGIFNAPSGGTLVFQYLLDEPITMVSGDQVQITQTITL